MGKRKRGRKDRPLTHEEIWDDSALIESWEAAAEEYKLYHSIQAKGENIEDALRDYEANEAAKAAEEGNEIDYGDDDAAIQDDGASAHDLRPGAAASGEGGEIMEEGEPKAARSYAAQEPAPKRPRQNETQGVPVTQPEANQSSGAFTSVPHMVLGTADASTAQEDESLKHLMMAWYFAGYYTGLYEGQRRANPQPQT
uniref:Survival Motor Neuron Gemin2-binding domain-containing protein n=1 Tax=Coccidioides posadasii RMSCC 3488 TaxID=454284 RepID=A0A0J6INM1_COCPO|nr:hypothetical protein CPAG_09810 [Coccidioides posadasii RMSCC 3488]